MEPDYCNSMHCSNYGCDYCMECSHAIFFGKGIDKNEKLWKWEFSPYYGPTFLKKDGEPRKCQPSYEKHPAWEPFEKWLKEKLGKKIT